MLIELLIHLLVSAVLLLLTAKFVSGFKIESYGTALIGAAVLGLVNMLVRPLVVVLTIPLTIITLGLFLFVVNALMLMLASALVPGIKVNSFGAAFLASLLLSIFNLLASVILGI